MTKPEDNPWVKLAFNQPLNIDEYAGTKIVEEDLSKVCDVIKLAYAKAGFKDEAEDCASKLMSIVAVRNMRKNAPEAYKAMLVNLISYDPITADFRNDVVDVSRKIAKKAVTRALLWYNLFWLIAISVGYGVYMWWPW